MEQEIETYSIFENGFHELPTFEDALMKGYHTDDNLNKIDTFSVRCYPTMLNHALRIIKRENSYASTSHIERVGILYGISLLQINENVQQLIDYSGRISLYCEDEEILNSFNTVSRLNYLTSSCNIVTSVSLLAWCKNWLSSNSADLGLNKSQLGIYALLLGISRYTIRNKIVNEKIQREVTYFLKYLSDRNQSVLRQGIL